MTIQKDSIVQEFLQQCPFITEYLYFDFLREHDGSTSLSPVSNDRAVKYYVNGTAIRQYDFALQILLQLSDTTDAVNTENIFKLRVWQDWIEEQEANKNYPDFGDRCSDYRWLNLSGEPVRAMVFDNGLAKYQFFARLQYREVK